MAPPTKNSWLRACRLPSSQTTAIVTPALKKPGLDPSDMKNYRPISNLSFMSKVVERIVVRQLSEYLAANSLLPKLQSGFRRHHSTESALLRGVARVMCDCAPGDMTQNLRPSPPTPSLQVVSLRGRGGSKPPPPRPTYVQTPPEISANPLNFLYI